MPLRHKFYLIKIISDLDSGDPWTFSEFDVMYMRDDIVLMKYELKLGRTLWDNDWGQKELEKQIPGIWVVSTFGFYE